MSKGTMQWYKFFKKDTPIQKRRGKNAKGILCQLHVDRISKQEFRGRGKGQM